MRIALVVDGQPEEVVVDLAASTVTVRGVAHPLKVARPDGKVELEVDGELLAIEGWPVGLARPPGPVSVNGEVVVVEFRSVSGPAHPIPAPTPTPASAPASRAVEPPEATSTGAGMVIVPPMPGKVIDVRVRDGDAVRRGQLLLVLEAMKMRNEVVSPADGRVAGLRVAAGTNVRAREEMLRVIPG
jgi:biotin carboxyl carrier protein